MHGGAAANKTLQRHLHLRPELAGVCRNAALLSQQEDFLAFCRQLKLIDAGPGLRPTRAMLGAATARLN